MRTGKQGLGQRFWQAYASAYKRVWVLALLALALCLPVSQLKKLSLAKELESRSQDLRFRLASHASLADSNIVMIAIDQASLKYAAELGQGWPFPRSFYAIISQYLTAEQAKAIVFDILFDEADFYRGEDDPGLSDLSFAQAMQSGANCFLAFSPVNIPSVLPSGLEQHSVSQNWAKALPAAKFSGAVAPIPSFCESAAGIGAISLPEGTDAILRSVPALYQLSGRKYANLALAAYLHENTETPALPLDEKGNIAPFWYGPGGENGVFTYLPFSALLHSAVANQTGDEPALANGYFKGKTVFIGATAAGLMDLKSSPYTWGMPGMELWATLLSNLRAGHHLRFLEFYQHFLYLYLLILAVLIVVTRLPAAFSPLALALLLLSICLASFVAFAKASLMLDFTSLIVAWLLAWLLILSLSYWAEGKHKKELRQVFNRYLHPDLVDRITANPGLVQMGGEELSATVMFSDIYNFTRYSESRKAPELVSHLNEYFGTFTNTILDAHGMLDKYTGDGLMAVFGAPLARADHALCACKAAIAHSQMCRELADKEDKSPSDLFHLGTRIGINSGNIVSGNIGSARRMEYTSIGDPVNLASRLEGVNKVFGTHIIISEATWEQVKEQFIARELDYLKVKGKDMPTRIYELLDEINSPRDYGWIKLYAQALALYRQGDFARAAIMFDTLCNAPYCDSAAKTMHSRCLALEANPPTNWQGIMILAEK